MEEINQAISPLLTKLNEKPFQKLEGSRRSLFERNDQAALRQLSAFSYEFAMWRKVKANIDYHVEADKSYYSVPYQLVKQELEVRLTQSVVEISTKAHVWPVTVERTSKGNMSLSLHTARSSIKST